MDVLIRRSTILGVGAGMPAGRREAGEIERGLGLPEGWIRRRTGVRAIPAAGPDEATSDLAVAAGRRAIAAAGLAPSRIRLLLLATSTPDHPLPPTAPVVASRLGLGGAGAVDVAGACAGFLYALALADAHVRLRGESVLVVGANVLTRRVDPADPATSALFGDGAGAVVLGPAAGPGGLLAAELGSDGEDWDDIHVPAGGSRFPLTPERVAAGEHYMRLADGRAVFRKAVRGLVETGRAALAAARLGPADIDLWIPHQANTRILAEAGRMLRIPPSRTVDVVADIGNSSAATIPVALAGAVAGDRVHRGDRLLLTAVGAGWVRAGIVLTW